MPTTNRTLAIAQKPAAAEVLATTGTSRNSNRRISSGNRSGRGYSSSRYQRNITDISRSKGTGNRAGMLAKMGMPATAGTSATHELM